MHFPYLFSPITLNKLELKNRIVMTAMHLGYTPDGEVTDRLLGFYRLRARGGVGLIIVGGCPIDEEGSMPSMIGIHNDRFIPGLQRLTKAIKGEGARIAAQLYQAGRYTHSSMIGGRKPFSASAVRSKLTGEIPRALDLEEIPGIQDLFVQAAMRALEAGFDAIEILASAGYLISQFLSPITNKRQDRYGGSLENRMRFGLEIVHKIRRNIGPDYPIIIRLAGNDFMPGGHTNEEAKIFAKELETAGVDLFNITGGWHETRIPQLSTFVPPGAFVYLAQGIKSVVSKPVLASNRINDPVMAEEVIRNGETDLVTMARALIADPEMPEKARNGYNDRITHCIACNQGCFDRIFQGKPAGCLVNPLAGHEFEVEITPTKRKKKVLVIGGGPAGLKAACTAAQRGHEVILIEKDKNLGGQFRLNKFIPGRQEMIRLVEDLENNMRYNGVHILFEQEATKAYVRSLLPDAIILATGARPILPDIEGIEEDNVFYAWDVLKGRYKLGANIVIIGGNALGLETALFLSNQGTLSPEALHFLATNRAEKWETLEDLMDRGNKIVKVIEMKSRAGEDIGLSTRWTVMAEVKRLGIYLITKAKAVRIDKSGVEIEKKGEKVFLTADSVVIAAGSESVKEFEQSLKGMAPEFYTIGDAKKVGNAMDAVQQGFEVGLKV